jgi:hypothetical protein
MKNMLMRKTTVTTRAALATCLLSASALVADADTLKAFYFGNSYLENSVPWFHPALARSAGHEMAVQTQIGPGWQVWMHVDTFYKKPDGAKKTLREGDWDAVVLQHFGTHPLLQENVRSTVFHNQEPFPAPRDVSDFASAGVIIDTFLTNHPHRGRAFIYNSWPGITGADEFRQRVRDEAEKSFTALGLSREEVLKQVKERKPTLAEMTPWLKAFSFESEWLAKYRPNRETPHESKHSHSRDYVWSLMELLKMKYPKLWEEGRLALIPTGDVFLALDKKMRAGRVPGIENVGFFSRDGGHIRAGLPRYTVAATWFAVMFREHPGKLDATIYNHLENYRNENLNKLPGKIGPGYVHWPDLGELLEITPERKKIVDDTVWEVVSEHPYSRVKN